MPGIFRKISFCLAACAAGCAGASGARSRRHHLDVDHQHALRSADASRSSRTVTSRACRRTSSSAAAAASRTTRRAMRPDVAAVKEVFQAIGGKRAVNLLLTGHSHFDHSFDTATWARALRRTHHRLAHHLPAGARREDSCASAARAVYGGEKFALEPGVDMYVIRWNHSGDPAKNPEQHDPVELGAVPVPDEHWRIARRGRRRLSERRRQSRLSCSRWMALRAASAGCSRIRPAPSICASPIVDRRQGLRRAARQSARGHARRRCRLASTCGSRTGGDRLRIWCCRC